MLDLQKFRNKRLLDAIPNFKRLKYFYKHQLRSIKSLTTLLHIFTKNFLNFTKQTSSKLHNKSPQNTKLLTHWPLLSGLGCCSLHLFFLFLLTLLELNVFLK